MIRAELLRLRAARGLLAGVLVALGLLVYAHYQGTQVTTDMSHGWERLEQAPTTLRDSSFLESQRLARVRIETAKTAYSPRGAAIVAMGMLSSGVGVGLAVILGAWSFGGEFTSPGLRYWALRQPRRFKIYGAKAATGAACLVSSGLTLFLCIALVNALANRRLSPLIKHGASWHSLTPGPVIRLVTPIALVCSLGFALGSLAVLITRSWSGGLLFAGGVVTSDLMLSRLLKPYSPWSMALNIWSVASGYRGSLERVATPLVWIRDFPTQTPSALRASVYLILLTIALVGFGIERLRRLEL
jgi:hypothetical protein